LAILDSLDEDLLVEDMLRHRSWWVWVGEFLHPHEYAKRFPKAARAFHIVRGKAPDGTHAPAFRTFYARVEAAIDDGDVRRLTDILAARPGEFARRFDHALRLAGDDDVAADYVTSTFERLAPTLPTPLLVNLHALLPTRTEPASVRLFWPPGNTANGASKPDDRPTLPPDHVMRATHAARAALLDRFARKGGPSTWLLDEALRDVVVPFNERTASSAAVSLTRGSRLRIPEAKAIRLFLHWCEPQRDARTTDLDLSVGFYTGDWDYAGVCSYYQLACEIGGDIIARSSGDFTSAPWPDGASEFVDVDRVLADRHDIRYAVMVVTAYSGLPFGMLERGYAGVMLRDSLDAAPFDPRTVELKFELRGARGVFLPLVFDLQTSELHWLDTYSRGELFFNNVESANRDITRMCPEAMTYFASGARPSMFELGLLHAAARAERVFLRGDSLRCFERRPTETRSEFYQRIRAGAGGETVDALPGGDIFALLFRGDWTPSDDSTVYALFRDQLAPNLSASDLLT